MSDKRRVTPITPHTGTNFNSYVFANAQTSIMQSNDEFIAEMVRRMEEDKGKKVINMQEEEAPLVPLSNTGSNTEPLLNDDDIEYDADATLPMSNSWNLLDSDNDLPKPLDMRGMVLGNINIPRAEECDSDGLFSDEEEEKPKRERLVYTESEEEKPKKKQKTQGQKVQRYLFTWNNPALSGDEFADFLKDIDAVTGFVFQLEVGENGTPHFQGYVEFSKRMYTTGVQSLLAPYRMSLLHAKGNKAQNYAYCTKEDTRTEGPWTYGTCSPENVKVKNGAQGKRSDMDVFADMVREKGGLTNEVIDAMPGHAMRYNKHARDLVQLQKVNDAKDAEIEMWKREYEKMMNGEEFTGQEQRKCILYFGPTAVGKTTKVKMEVMGRLGLRCYEKQSNNKWWDGYDGELHVLMDEFKGAAYGPIEDFNALPTRASRRSKPKGRLRCSLLRQCTLPRTDTLAIGGRKTRTNLAIIWTMLVSEPLLVVLQKCIGGTTRMNSLSWKPWPWRRQWWMEEGRSKVEGILVWKYRPAREGDSWLQMIRKLLYFVSHGDVPSPEVETVNFKMNG